MAYSTVPKVRRDGTITLRDGTGSPVTLAVAYEEGNFSFDQTKADRIVIRDRALIATVRKGDEQPLTGSFSFYMRQFTSASVGGVMDFINKQNAYAANISTGAGTPYVEEYCIDIVFTVDGSSVGDDSGDDLQTATFSKCICTAAFAEGDPNQITISFECYNGITYTAS
jgi:hypothetical protein